MATTHTGSFPIGFRRERSDWQRDLSQLVAFAAENDFEFVDFGPASPEELREVLAAGVRIGSVDLKDWKDLAAPDAGRRRAAAQANAEYVRSLMPLGVRVFFAVVIPEDPARRRAENFDFAVDGYGQLAAAVAPGGAKIVLEGWPGAAPHFASLACTPADCRAFFRAAGSDALGVNFDPSHLIRMGIDAERFLSEFGSRVFHVHGKDTELLPQGLYEHGHLQPATFAKPHGFGGHHWRYTIPGRGAARWGRLLSILQAAGYGGLLSIELEDEQFHGSAAGEQRGLLASRDFLAKV